MTRWKSTVQARLDRIEEKIAALSDAQKVRVNGESPKRPKK